MDKANRLLTEKEIKEKYFLRKGFSINSIELKDEKGNKYIFDKGTLYKIEMVEDFILIK